ncbi:MAG: alanyl-tRNA editing protein, partial [Acidobacteriaceae bacterium]|nr:alanyl-tRNA editing protein [Acidobacteriaceae bacterium]
MKTERLYYIDCYLTNFRANVTDIQDSGTRVYLDKTAFYPNSGGQPNDLGTLNNIPILDIVDEEDRVAHVLSEPLASAEEVEGSIDWARRYDHMQQHTGQHLLSAILVELFGAQTVSFHMGREVSTIEVDARELTASQLEKAEDLASVRAAEARPVRIRFEDADAAVTLRKPSQRTGTLRIIDIEGVDSSACGGTHVRSTAEVGPLLIRGAEKLRGNIRLEFVCGRRALNLARNDLRILQQLSRHAATSVDRLPEHFLAVRERLSEAEKTSEKLAGELARRDGEALYQSTMPDMDGIRRAVAYVTSIDAPLRAQAQAYAKGKRAIFLAAGSEPATVLLACSPDSGVNAGQVLKQVLAAAG